jgi:enoyl-CoA hydratase
MIVRGSGPCFSAGYDLAQDRSETVPWPLSRADGAWARHVLTGWFEMMDMATPIIAQVHGWCLAGGTELATACDLVYVAEDAQVGYPPVRLMSSPDMAWQPWLMGMRRAMEAMLTGDAMSGVEAVEAGFANRAFPAAELDERVLEVAGRVAKVPSDLQAVNKRVVHRAMEAMGMRQGMRATAELNAIGFHQRSSIEYFAQLREGVTSALSARDRDFGDYREGESICFGTDLSIGVSCQPCRRKILERDGYL